MMFINKLNIKSESCECKQWDDLCILEMLAET